MEQSLCLDDDTKKKRKKEENKKRKERKKRGKKVTCKRNRSPFPTPRQGV